MPTTITRTQRFCREQARECRNLARLTDEIGQRLTEMAAECDDRARAVESAADQRRTEDRPSPPLQPNETIEALTLSIRDTAKLLGLGRTTIYRLIGERQLQTVKIGNRTLIKTASIRSLVEDQSE